MKQKCMSDGDVFLYTLQKLNVLNVLWCNCLLLFVTQNNRCYIKLHLVKKSAKHAHWEAIWLYLTLSQWDCHTVHRGILWNMLVAIESTHWIQTENLLKLQNLCKWFIWKSTWKNRDCWRSDWRDNSTSQLCWMWSDVFRHIKSRTMFLNQWIYRYQLCLFTFTSVLFAVWQKS